MKKTLLAAALIAGYAGAASAQNSVTLYGVVDLGFAYQNIKTGNSGLLSAANQNKTLNQIAMASGQQSGSRWGLKGVEDLGNGLKANFVYEASVNANNGSGNDNFSRQSTVGLTSDKWGAIDLGRKTTSGTWAFSGIDPFAAGFGQAALDTSMGAQFIRLSNMIQYTSPSISGFALSGTYSFDTGLTAVNSPETAQSFGTSTKQRALSTGIRYANGPILVAGMFDAYMSPSGSESVTVKQWNIGGSYDFKVAKVSLAYGQNIDGIVEGSNTLSNAGVSGGDTNSRGGILYAPGARTQSWMIGLTAPVGTGSVFGSVQQMKPSGDFSIAGLSTQTTASIGYSYPLSKRTNVYAYYSYMNNAVMLSGAKAQTLGVGVRHLF